MPLTPEQAGFNRGLNDEEKCIIEKFCFVIDAKLREAYNENPTATSVYVEYQALPYVIRNAVESLYENIGWTVRWDSSQMDGTSYMILVPKGQVK